MPKIKRNLEEEYDQKYGHLPNTQKELLSYLDTNLHVKKDKVEERIQEIENITWTEREIVIYAIPKPSARPRYSFETKHFYVPNAVDNKKLIKRYILQAGIICTRTHFSMKTFQPTPRSSMTKEEVYLAEMGYIEPISNPDFDNLAKTYTDAIQGLLLLNDNIVSKGLVEKYYSIKPRIEIKLRYQDDFDCNFNRRKITTSTAYKRLILQDTIELETE